MEKQKKFNELFIPFIIVLAGTLFMVISLFLPYSTAIGDHEEYINRFSDEIAYEELDMTYDDTMNLSMAEYAKVYGSMGQSFTLYVALVVLIGGFSSLALLFACLKKPIPIIIFTVLAFLVFCLQNWDYSDRGVVPSSDYDWGAAYYIFPAAAAVAFIGSICLLVQKIKINRKCVHNLENS